MSRFFKSAAFPILIVVVLAFFASKLVSDSGKGPTPTYGQLVQDITNRQVTSLNLDQKDDSATFTIVGSTQKFTTGYPDNAAPALVADETKYQSAAAVNVQDKSTSGWLSLLTYLLPFVIFIGFWLFLINQVQ